MPRTQCGNMTTRLQLTASSLDVAVFRGLVIALCFFVCSQASAATVSSNNTLHELSKTKVWQLLLHSNGKKSFISDERFFLHSGTFDPARELMKSVDAFKQSYPLNDEHPICRFPARFKWLSEKLHFNPSDYPKPKCTSYNEYKLKVPVNEIDLVFASENIISPSSMMGHVFIKLSGKDSRQNLVEHAVTYFTVLDSINIPKIIYQNLFGGMEGLFALQPYRQIKNNYLKIENRNIWEYSLTLTSEQLEFIRAHIWELKDMDSSYFFGDYNCATITYLLLAMVFPEKLQPVPDWLSPLDVVKAIHEHNLVNSTEVVTSDHWKIHMMKDQVNSGFDPTVISGLKQNDVREVLGRQSPIEKIYTQTYLHYLRDHDIEAYQIHQELYDNIDVMLSNDTQNYALDYSNYKDPVQTPGSQHLQVSYGQYQHDSFIGLAFLPAAVRLTDDQRQYFSTRELRMFEVSARLFTNGKVKVDNLTLYAVKSLSPWNSITKSISGQWRLNAENHFDNMLNQHFVLNGSAGLGYTVNLSGDVSLSALYNVGVASNIKQTYLYHFPEITLQMDEIWDMKTIATLSSNFHMYNSGMRSDSLKVCQSYFQRKSSTFHACMQRTQNRLFQRDEFQVSFEQNF